MEASRNGELSQSPGTKLIPVNRRCGVVTVIF